MSKRIEIDITYMVNAYNSGKTFEQIGRELGVSKTLIIDRAREIGLKSRGSGQRRLPFKIGEKYNSLTIISEINNHPRRYRYICRCDCGNILEVTPTALKRGQKFCMTCRNRVISERKWRGHGEISGDYWGSIKRSARERRLVFDIEIEYGWRLYLEQNRQCALSGLPINFVRATNKGDRPTASLDRISSDAGYVIENVQWVHKDINYIKMDFDEKYFVYLCGLVTNKHLDTHRRRLAI